MPESQFTHNARSSRNAGTKGWRGRCTMIDRQINSIVAGYRANILAAYDSIIREMKRIGEVLATADGKF